MVLAEGAVVDLRNWLDARRQQIAAAEPAPGLGFTFSAGVVPASGLELDDALRQADYALYEAKRSGRNRVVIGSAPARWGPTAVAGEDRWPRVTLPDSRRLP